MVGGGSGGIGFYRADTFVVLGILETRALWGLCVRYSPGRCTGGTSCDATLTFIVTSIILIIALLKNIISVLAYTYDSLHFPDRQCAVHSIMSHTYTQVCGGVVSLCCLS